MTNKLSVYPGEKISVHYDVKRCIHATECAHGLPSVFDPKRKPWVNPNEAAADEVVQVVQRCPTGALHFMRHDGGVTEPVPDHNTITASANGPLFLRGDLEVMDPDGSVFLKDTRIALCRCGASKNKPFCDGSHAKKGFQDTGVLGVNVVKTVEADSQDRVLRISPSTDGPFALKGEAEIVSADGQTCYSGNRMFLCRCGASSNKPFCDGTHAKIGFTSGE